MPAELHITADTDCRLPEGHRYNAAGRCEWCDAEQATHSVLWAQPGQFMTVSTLPYRLDWLVGGVGHSLVCSSNVSAKRLEIHNAMIAIAKGESNADQS